MNFKWERGKVGSNSFIITPINLIIYEHGQTMVIYRKYKHHYDFTIAEIPEI